MIAAVISTIFGLVEGVQMSVLLYFVEPNLVLITAALAAFRLGHASISLMVCKRLWAIDSAMKIEPYAGVEML